MEWTADSSLVDYETNSMLRAAVERTFEIIGEALLRLERTDPDTAARISDYRRIIGFRNRLVHGYDDINNQQVWEIIRTFLPVLSADVNALLEEIDA
ncbi:MAG: DUF86 domain-containing protein [Chloroflexota bacterium]|nr:DUF86 domain-containing protein [Chloroflexota bacterium]